MWINLKGTKTEATEVVQKLYISKVTVVVDKLGNEQRSKTMKIAMLRPQSLLFLNVCLIIHATMPLQPFPPPSFPYH